MTYEVIRKRRGAQQMARRWLFRVLVDRLQQSQQWFMFEHDSHRRSLVSMCKREAPTWALLSKPLTCSFNGFVLQYYLVFLCYLKWLLTSCAHKKMAWAFEGSFQWNEPNQDELCIPVVSVLLWACFFLEWCAWNIAFKSKESYCSSSWHFQLIWLFMDFQDQISRLWGIRASLTVCL